jgi:hypothetical protein
VPLPDGSDIIKEALLVEDEAAFSNEGSFSSYLTYGMRIRSELALPELPTTDGATDVIIRFGRVDVPHSSVDGLQWTNEDEACLSFERIGSFLVRQGHEIVVDPAPGEDERWVRNAVMGPVMGILLYQRGWLTLHASSTAVDGMVVAFMADRGWGKSTMAAAMVARGHDLVADDITAVETREDDPKVAPGYPLLKLWPEAIASIKEDPAALPEIAPGAHKRSMRVHRDPPPTLLSLGCIYVLDVGQALEIEPLRPQEALTELIRNTYGRKLLQTVKPASHLQHCANVVNSVPIRRLRRPQSLEALSDVVQRVEGDLVHIADKKQ